MQTDDYPDQLDDVLDAPDEELLVELHRDELRIDQDRVDSLVEESAAWSHRMETQMPGSPPSPDGGEDPPGLRLGRHWLEGLSEPFFTLRSDSAPASPQYVGGLDLGTPAPSPSDERGARFAGIVSQETLRSQRVILVGCGAIGRQIGLALASMGVGTVELWDHDTVDPVNLGTQGWLHSQLGQLKTQALAEEMRWRQTPVLVIGQPNAWRPIVHLRYPAVFCCVDSMTVRKQLYRKFKEEAEARVERGQPYGFFCDTRMAALTWRLYTLTDAKSARMYPRALFSDDQALQQSCTAQSTFFCASSVAAAAINEYVNHLRGFPVSYHVEHDLLARAYGAWTADEWERHLLTSRTPDEPGDDDDTDETDF